MLGRMVLGWAVAVAALTFIAPFADADPQSDAVDAIDAAWTAAGGEGSQLGAREGDVFAAGAGFAQDFAGGAIFFTPDTGARLMYGPVLEKYRELGGPADSDLGFPNIDEGPGRISPDSRNSTFSAADQPVIFWTPDTGAWVVRGAINAAWDTLGGSAGTLGVPVADETFDGDVVSQKFTGGQISFDSRTQKFTTDPEDLAAQLGDVTVPGDATSAINAAYRAAGGASGPLGARQGDPFTIGSDGTGQSYAGGKIFYSPATGAHAVTGAILEKYEAAGGPDGDLGFPSAGEVDGGVPNSRMSSFAAQDNPVIFWTSDHGATVVRGAMKTAWDKLGGATGTLGVPLSDQSADGDNVTQKFSGGQISWNSANRTFSTDPANLAESLGELQVPSPAPGSPPSPAPAAEKDSAFTWHSWWLWWIIPLALLLLASLVAWLTSRRRTAAQPDSRFDRLAEPESSGERQRWSADPDDARGSPGWSPNADQEAEPSSPQWQERWDTGSPSAGAEIDTAGSDYELFTHPGAHAAEPADDPDAVDTAPTRIQGDTAAESSGRHAAVSTDDFDAAWQPGGADPLPSDAGAAFQPPAPAPAPHAEGMEPDIQAVRAEEDFLYGGVAPGPVDQVPHIEHYEPPAPPLPAVHLPLDDPGQAPDGYPVKASMAGGTYHLPGGANYDTVVADLWFLDAEHAEANGFTRSD
jgi:uncharacterized protein with LGFP repeats